MAAIQSKARQTTAAANESHLLVALDRLQSLERDISERLIRLEENLGLLRQDLLGNGQPGRLSRLDLEVHQLHAESLRQRGILAAISFLVSTAIALISQFLFH